MLCFQNFSGTFRGQVKIPIGLMFVLLSELWNTKQGMGRIIKMSVQVMKCVLKFALDYKVRHAQN